MVLCCSGLFLEAIIGFIWDAFLDANWDANWDFNWDSNWDVYWDANWDVNVKIINPQLPTLDIN